MKQHYKPYAMSSNDVVNLLIKSQLLRAKHITPVKYKETPSPIRSNNQYSPNKSPMGLLNNYKYKPHVTRSPNFYRNKYQSFNPRKESGASPSTLMNLVNLQQTSSPSNQLSEQMRDPQIKELHDFISDQVSRYYVLNGSSRNQDIIGNVTKMLNNYILFINKLIESINPNATPQTFTIPKLQSGSNYFQPKKSSDYDGSQLTFNIRSEPSQNTANLRQQTEYAQLDDFSYQNPQQIHNNHQETKRFINRTERSENSEKSEKSLDNRNYINQYSSVRNHDDLSNHNSTVEDVGVVAKTIANEYLQELFDIGTMKVDFIAPSRHYSEAATFSQSQIRKRSDHSFGSNSVLENQSAYEV